jgi:hypothetical protein
MDVPSFKRCVRVAASASGMNGSWLTSDPGEAIGLSGFGQRRDIQQASLHKWGYIKADCSGQGDHL